MIVTLEKELNIIGERTFENHQMLKQARRQRRTEFTDIYGVPFKTEKTEGATERFRCHLFISTDLEYWERFQFKLRVSGSDTVTEDAFAFRVIDLDDNGDEKDPIDLSEYLIEQNGTWVDSDGYFPTEEIGDESIESADFFDVLIACSDMWAEGRTSAVNKILEAGTKIISITAAEDVNITFIPYIKYSTVNR